MAVSSEQLATFGAIVDLGTFEAAARKLSVTPSAVSQRIRALESHVGQVLLVRSTPCRVTDAGAVLLRMARQQQMLEEEALGDLSGARMTTMNLPVAVNADSLATWFHELIEKSASWEDTTLQIHLEDETLSSRLLRQGEVLGAVTSDPAPVQGCSVQPLGKMRYLPVATPQFLQKWRLNSELPWASMPVVRFNANDHLPIRLLRAHGVKGNPPTPFIPSAEGYLAAVQAGLGWGMVPEDKLTEHLAARRLVRLHERDKVDILLYWQHWRLSSPRLERLTAAIASAAAASLRH
ncbi:MAG: LysR family transcriptional regulator ArgP [Geodermatophilaceae bacterium]